MRTFGFVEAGVILGLVLSLAGSGSARADSAACEKGRAEKEAALAQAESQSAAASAILQAKLELSDVIFTLCGQQVSKRNYCLYQQTLLQSEILALGQEGADSRAARERLEQIQAFCLTP